MLKFLELSKTEFILLILTAMLLAGLGFLAFMQI